MAVLASMQQAAGADPTQRLVAALPPLGYTVNLSGGQGVMNMRVPLLNLFGSAMQVGGCVGPFSFIGNALKACFVDMQTMASWNTEGVEGAAMALLEAMPGEAAQIDAPNIEGQPVEAAAASTGLFDVEGGASISPAKIMQHERAVAASAGIDLA